MYNFDEVDLEQYESCDLELDLMNEISDELTDDEIAKMESAVIEADQWREYFSMVRF